MGFGPMLQLTSSSSVVAVFETWVILWRSCRNWCYLRLCFFPY